jgi:hypothetical protein
MNFKMYKKTLGFGNFLVLGKITKDWIYGTFACEHGIKVASGKKNILLPIRKKSLSGCRMS